MKIRGKDFKYTFLQIQQIFGITLLIVAILLIVFDGFLSFENGFSLEQAIGLSAFYVPLLGIIFVSIMLASYYQLLCPFYLSFSVTRKGLFIRMKLLGLAPILEFFLVSGILLIFANADDRPLILASYSGMIGMTFISQAIGEFMGALCLSSSKFGRIFPAILGGIAGGIGGISASVFSDLEETRHFSAAYILDHNALALFIIGIVLYCISNIVTYRSLKKMSVY